MEEEEAQKLQKEEKDIIVEEDIIITASRKNGVDKTKKNKKVKKSRSYSLWIEEVRCI